MGFGSTHQGGGSEAGVHVSVKQSYNFFYGHEESKHKEKNECVAYERTRYPITDTQLLHDIYRSGQ